jgi:hypothetical protein
MADDSFPHLILTRDIGFDETLMEDHSLMAIQQAHNWNHHGPLAHVKLSSLSNHNTLPPLTSLALPLLPALPLPPHSIPQTTWVYCVTIVTGRALTQW